MKAVKLLSAVAACVLSVVYSFGGEDSILRSGFDVIGQGALCLDPVPSSVAPSKYRVPVDMAALRGGFFVTNGVPLYLGLDGKWHRAVTPGDIAASTTNRMHSAELVYRYRTVDSVTQWKSVVLRPVWFDTIFSPDVPGEPCDMEFYVSVDYWNTYYSYLDYSGAGLGVPGYSERPESPMSTTFETCRPRRENFCTTRSWLRVRGHRSRILHVGCETNVTAETTVEMPGTADNYVAGLSSGYRITAVRRDVHGLNVSFDTPCEPPYTVAVYPIRTIGLSRRRPIVHVEVQEKSAFVPLRGHYDETMFVQVGSDLGIESDLTEGELKAQREAAARVRPVVNDSPSPDGEGSMHLVGEGRWVGFIPSASDEVTVDVCGTMAVSDPDNPPVVIPELSLSAFVRVVATNWVAQAFSASGSNRLVFPSGTSAKGGYGYRVTLDEGGRRVMYSRAYSSEPGRSDEYVLGRLLRTLSVDHDRHGSSVDWTGSSYRQKYTNAVPGRVYINGL